MQLKFLFSGCISQRDEKVWRHAPRVGSLIEIAVLIEPFPPSRERHMVLDRKRKRLVFLIARLHSDSPFLSFSNPFLFRARDTRVPHAARASLSRNQRRFAPANYISVPQRHVGVIVARRHGGSEGCFIRFHRRRSHHCRCLLYFPFSFRAGNAAENVKIVPMRMHGTENVCVRGQS